jgi:ABC-type polysaccharide/polyol phosphate export permease
LVRLVILDLNPMAIFVDSYRDVLYHLRMPTGMQWLLMTLIALLTLAVGVATFRRFEPKLAEEL